MSEKELIQMLQWRYATKKFDPDSKLGEETQSALLESLRLSPSSMGLQPYVFVRITNADLRRELRAVSSDQAQITEASELIVFAAKTEISDDEIENFVRLGGELRGHTPEAMEKRIASVKRFVANHTPEALFEWSARQAYIAIGQIVTSAAVLGVDACPMEGIKKDEYNRILELDAHKVKALAVVTLGYRSIEDATASYPKVRKSMNELFITKN
jgi:nitroreductase